MSRNHWSGWSEAELAHMRSARRTCAGRPSRGLTPREGGRASGVTAEPKGVTGRVAQEPRSGRVAGRGRIHWLMSSDAAPSVVSARGAR